MPSVYKLLRHLFVLGFLAFLVSCSGGGGSSHATNPPVALLIDNTVPTQTQTAITNYVSGEEIVSSSSKSIVLPASAYGPSLVAAVDASNNVLLAGYASQGGGATLSIASTALVMARIALEPLPSSGISIDQVNADILAASEYSNFLTQISNALGAGIAPANSPDVLSSLAIVVSQVQTAILSSVPQTIFSEEASIRSGSTIARSKAISPPPLPYTLLQGNRGVTAVSLADSATPGNGVTLSNYSMLQWDANTANISGIPIATVNLSELGVWGSLLSAVTTGSLAKPTPLAGDEAQFTVGISQNNATRKYNIANAAVSVTQALLVNLADVGGSSTCLNDTIAALVNEDLPSLANSHDVPALRDYIKGLFSPSKLLDTLKAAKCLGLSPAEAAAGTALGTFAAVVSLAVNSGTTYGIVTQLAAWWDYSKQVEICKVNGQIVACALSIDAPKPFLAVGQSEQLTAIVNSNGQPYSNPVALTWNTIPDESTIASVSSTGLVTANANVGPVTVQVADPYQDVATQNITIDIPTIRPNNPTVAVGQTVALMLVDPNNNVLTLDPAWTWSSSDETLARVDSSTGLVTGLVGGSAITITAADPNSPSQMHTTTIVSISNDYTVGGSVSGLTGTGLVLLDNGGDALPISADGNFTFPTPLASNTAYNVTVGTQPSGGQTCSVSGGGGTVGAENVTSVSVSCTNTCPAAVNTSTVDSAKYVCEGGLTWMPITFHDIWSSGNSFCASFNGLGLSGWRMPTLEELESLAASRADDNQGWVLTITWSSTLEQDGYRYTVFLGYDNGLPAGDVNTDFDNFDDGGPILNGNHYVSCVR